MEFISWFQAAALKFEDFYGGMNLSGDNIQYGKIAQLIQYRNYKNQHWAEFSDGECYIPCLISYDVVRALNQSKMNLDSYLFYFFEVDQYEFKVLTPPYAQCAEVCLSIKKLLKPSPGSKILLKGRQTQLGKFRDIQSVTSRDRARFKNWLEEAERDEKMGEDSSDGWAELDDIFAQLHPAAAPSPIPPPKPVPPQPRISAGAYHNQKFVPSKAQINAITSISSKTSFPSQNSHRSLADQPAPAQQNQIRRSIVPEPSYPSTAPSLDVLSQIPFQPRGNPMEMIQQWSARVIDLSAVDNEKEEVEILREESPKFEYDSGAEGEEIRKKSRLDHGVVESDEQESKMEDDATELEIEDNSSGWSDLIKDGIAAVLPPDIPSPTQSTATPSPRRDSDQYNSPLPSKLDVNSKTFPSSTIIDSPASILKVRQVRILPPIPIIRAMKGPVTYDVFKAENRKRKPIMLSKIYDFAKRRREGEEKWFSKKRIGRCDEDFN